MDNLAHALAGALIARSLPRRWAGGVPEEDPAFDPDRPRPGIWLTWSGVIAANLPDFEALVLWPPPLGDKAAYLLHHRGWSHSLIGIAAEAVAFTALLWLLARWRRTARWFAGFTPRRGLAVAALGVGSHLFMDWWNSYGVRPFYPWDRSWYYGDLVFIVDPWVWLILAGALICGTRRFGWTKWGWYALAAAATLIVAGACWQEQCPWWVLAAWATGVVEVGLLRWWGRWRFADLFGWGTLTAYLVTMGLWSQAAREAVTRETIDPHYMNRIHSIAKQSVQAVPGVPWDREVLNSHGRRGRNKPVGLLAAGDRRFDFDGASLIRVNAITGDRGPLHLWDAGWPHNQARIRPKGLRRVEAWAAFARHPVAQFRGSKVILGDVRYGAGGEEDWSALEVEYDILPIWESAPRPLENSVPPMN
ncbi:hypothetical protein CA12_37120 [Alienimonas californiensis]|uniref:Inner membrane protein n=2 Tax=Alienimonas californiensis TaxID=2527989 RepID=A0A517PDY8_9PLAN|nr:hypothetical protein CA12_37120 [Alienimonas californiensis]